MGLQLRFRVRLALDRLQDRLGVSPPDAEEGSPRDRLSPRVVLPFEVAGRPAALSFGRPAARGRVVFGDLVPWGALWRTGADEATVLYLPVAAHVAGMPLRRGRYSLYTVPEADSWTVVVNRSIRQSGRTRDEVGAKGNRFSNAYTGVVAASEVGRAPVPVVECPLREALTASVIEQSNHRTVLRLEWERRGFDLPIVVSP